MVVNDSSVVDDFGQRHAWVELYNSTFAPLEISSVFLTNDKDNNKKYPVPLGDVNTEIPARQHVLFWADGQPNKGTFHMNFTLTPGEDNYIAIYDANGLSLIDEVVVPASLKPGQSYARKVDGEGGTDADAWEVRDGSGQYYITPSSNNVIKDTNGKVEMFAEQDENGFGMAVMAMGVVFTALLLLSLCFYIISKIGEGVSRKNKVKTVTAHLDEVHDSHKDHDSGEAIAAIVMALHEHLDAHDRESTVLTINKVRRAYSPWNSKIYSLRELPRR
ncbi:MAG: OadG family protein [Duncaniella sp.]|nr:OadG family protein [Duncaniella sp.]MDE6325096.1 OadG family protein [Duncaniella sp.]MDE6494897.1 OadG family protein [Duncaniella sp.]